MAEYNDYDKSVVLEGMYKGVENKIEEVRESVSKEIQFSAAQQASSYEALTESLKNGIEVMLRELKYLSQQSSAIYDINQAARKEMEEEFLSVFEKRTEEAAKEVERRLDEKFEQLKRALLSSPAPLSAHEEPETAAAEAEAEGEGEPSETPAPRPVHNFDGEDGFDYDVLAEKIATILPETDYDMIADKVVAALPQADADAIADKVVAIMPVADESAIADKVAETIPMIDYDLVAERVGTTLEHDFYISLDESGLDAIADKVAAYLQEGIAEKIAERLADKLAAVPAQPAPAPAPQPVQEVAAAAAPAPAPAPAPKPKAPRPVPVVVPVVTDPSLTTRYKRSFTAKIIESEQEVKEYYSALKNELLSYSRVNSQINWSNDRYSYRGETVAKIGVRGRTLCVYLALNPNEFPESTYHQKFAGDTKMYEKTPLMMKVKSGVALKRTLRLIELLMERIGAIREEIEPVDYTAQFAFRSEEKLLQEGLIKTAIVEKSDLDF